MGLYPHTVRVYEDDYETLQQIKEDEGFGSIGEVVRCLLGCAMEYLEEEEDEYEE